jgi:thioredoxin reductase (NADPH)
MAVSVPDAPARPIQHPRAEQTFPELTPAEIARLRRFGAPRRYADGAPLFLAGEPGPGMFVVLEGQVAISQRDGLGRRTPVVEQGPGQFLAEVGQLSGRPALVDGHAEGEVAALLIPPDALRALIVAEAELGERIVRALILRRVSLIQSGQGGPLIVGPPDHPDVARLSGFLDRNGEPHKVSCPNADPATRDLVTANAATPEDLPLVITPSGEVLRNPANAALARAIGLVAAAPRNAVCDVGIVGAGPAGLAAAVYAASEGLSVTVLDAQGYGGQAGASARIENYFGFPTGITGRALTSRAVIQAEKFGADIISPMQVERLVCDGPDGLYRLELEGGGSVAARAVVIASGARYRRPAIPGIDAFEGRGVWYWASPIEARLCAGAEVALVGGGNSAGQAAVYLAAHAAKVRMLVRGPGLAATMSRYLIDRISAAPNIELMTGTEVTGLDGDPARHLEAVRWTRRDGGGTETRPIRNLFLFVGADPETGWLRDCDLALDRAGFVLTGAAVPGAGPGKPPLEASLPGIFAIGDVRAGSVKRVGGAIGEGAAVVAAIHASLAAPAAA